MTTCNPFIKVTWRDNPENFTKEKLKRVKSYFQNKYKTSNIRIVPESVINKNDAKLNSLDTTQKITDFNHQRDLMKDFIKENKVEVKWELLERLDNKVIDVLKSEYSSSINYNNWSINKIEFSNFLSFGDDNCLDFKKLNGITVVESIPENFGGKCLRKNTEIEIEFDKEEIIKKLGFLPDELKTE